MSVEDDIAEPRRSYTALRESHAKLQAGVAGQSAAMRGFAVLPVGTILAYAGDPSALVHGLLHDPNEVTECRSKMMSRS